MENLPVEIVLHILSFLPAADLIHAAHLNSHFWELAGDLQLLRQLDLRQAFTCTLEEVKAFLRPRGRCPLVHTLDMDAVYWLRPPWDLIYRMKNLKTLHLRGISVTFKQLHGLLTAGLQLEELSMEWPRCSPKSREMMQQMKPGLCHLRFLCLTMDIDEETDHFLRLCPPSLRLVFYPCASDNSVGTRRRIDTMTCDASSLHLYETILNTLIRRNLNMDQYGRLSTASQETEVVLQDLNNNNNNNNNNIAQCVSIMRSFANLKALQILNFGGKLAPVLDTIAEAVPALQRLAVSINNAEKEQWKGCVRSITSFRHLTHLSLPLLFLCDTVSSETSPAPSSTTTTTSAFTPSFKKPRLGVPDTNAKDAEAGILNVIINNCTLLTMLEVGVQDTLDRPVYKKGIYWHSLKNIKKLKRLTHLTLCNIPVTSGNFLPEVAVGCPKLKFLRLANLGPSGKCCYLKDLTQSVTVMACLTHLSVHQPYIAPGTALFNALSSCGGLQRLTITCLYDMLPINTLALEHLAKALPSLRFVGLTSVSTPQTAFNRLMANLKKISRPALTVVASNQRKVKLPEALAHRDMMDLQSWLSGSYANNSYHQDFPNRHFVLRLDTQTFNVEK